MTAAPPAKSSKTLTDLKAFLKDGRPLPMLNYVFLFFMVMTVGGSGVVALLIANFAEDKAPDWIKTHYQFQVRTFWIGVVPAILSYFLGQYLLHVLKISPMLMFFVVIPVLLWIVGRVAMGFNHLMYSRPIPNPKSWLV
jgi:uncharacterized membrane protein